MLPRIGWRGRLDFLLDLAAARALNRDVQLAFNASEYKLFPLPAG
jgi:hypothetical protein